MHIGKIKFIYSFYDNFFFKYFLWRKKKHKNHLKYKIFTKKQKSFITFLTRSLKKDLEPKKNLFFSVPTLLPNVTQSEKKWVLLLNDNNTVTKLPKPFRHFPFLGTPQTSGNKIPAPSRKRGTGGIPPPRVSVILFLKLYHQRCQVKRI